MNDIELIDVRNLLKKYSLEELNKAADEYFKNANVQRLLMKPFNDLVPTMPEA